MNLAIAFVLIVLAYIVGGLVATARTGQGPKGPSQDEFAELQARVAVLRRMLVGQRVIDGTEYEMHVESSLETAKLYANCGKA